MLQILIWQCYQCFCVVVDICAGYSLSLLSGLALEHCTGTKTTGIPVPSNSTAVYVYSSPDYTFGFDLHELTEVRQQQRDHYTRRACAMFHVGLCPQEPSRGQ